MIDILGTKPSMALQVEIQYTLKTIGYSLYLILWTIIYGIVSNHTSITHNVLYGYKSRDRISLSGSKIWLPHFSLLDMAGPIVDETFDLENEKFSIWSNGKISHVIESKYSVQYFKL